MKAAPKDYKRRANTYFGRLRAYDRSFTANLAFLYINGGFKVLYSVALKEMFKSYYKLSPNEL